jgi:hypothetical protein
MGKYYISFGKDFKKVIMAGNPYHACITVFKDYFLNNSEDAPTTISNCFRISQKGFDEHDDDELISTAMIIQLIAMSNKAKKDLAKLSQKKNNINKTGF